MAGSVKPDKTEVGLKRSLTLAHAVLYGLGVTIGAGIYVLIGSATEAAGPGVWVAFAVAGLAAMAGLGLVGPVARRGARHQAAELP